MTLFERIKETAKMRGVSLTALSVKAGLGEKTIYKWKEKEPSATRIKAVADVLGVSVDYLLGNTDDMHTPANSNAGTIDLREVSDSERYDIISAGGQPISDEDWLIIKAILAKYPRKED